MKFKLQVQRRKGWTAMPSQEIARSSRLAVALALRAVLLVWRADAGQRLDLHLGGQTRTVGDFITRPRTGRNL